MAQWEMALLPEEWEELLRTVGDNGTSGAGGVKRGAGGDRGSAAGLSLGKDRRWGRTVALC